MKVALDEGVPENVAEYLQHHDVQTVRQLGLKGVKNGKLLAVLEASGFDAFITNDKKMEAEGQLRLRPFSTLILSATNWQVIRQRVNKIVEALDACQPGSVVKVDCGIYIPRQKRKPG